MYDNKHWVETCAKILSDIFKKNNKERYTPTERKMLYSVKVILQDSVNFCKACNPWKKENYNERWNRIVSTPCNICLEAEKLQRSIQDYENHI